MYAAHFPCNPPPPDAGANTLRDLRRIRKNKATKFSKRRRNFIKKAHELHQGCEVDVFVCVRSKRNNQIWQYSSGLTPPSNAEMVGTPQ